MAYTLEFVLCVLCYDIITIFIVLQVSSDPLEDDFTQERKPGAYLTIFMYFVQVPALLKIDIIYRSKSNEETQVEDVGEKASSVFNFDSLGLAFDTCLFKNITPVDKVGFNAGFILYLFGVLLALYIVTFAVRMIGSQKFKDDGCGLTRLPFHARFIGAFVILILYTYEFLSESLFSLLNCVKIHSVGDSGEWRMWLDGTVQCMQGWQYGVIAIIAVYVVPMFFIVGMAPVLLKHHKIRILIFVLSLVFPLFALPYILFLFFKLCLKKPQSGDDNNNPQPVTSKRYGAVNLVVHLVAEPYKIDKMHGFCWEGMIILRRLILVVIATLMRSIIAKHILLVIVCLLSMVVHIRIKPFKKSSSNFLESLSLTLLLGIAIMNLCKAVYFDSGEIPLGMADTIFRIYDVVEHVLVSLIPLALLGFVIFCLVLRLILLPFDRICFKERNQLLNGEENEGSNNSGSRQQGAGATNNRVNGMDGSIIDNMQHPSGGFTQHPLTQNGNAPSPMSGETRPVRSMPGVQNPRYSDVTQEGGFTGSHGHMWGSQLPYQLSQRHPTNMSSTESTFVSGHQAGSPNTVYQAQDPVYFHGAR